MLGGLPLAPALALSLLPPDGDFQLIFMLTLQRSFRKLWDSRRNFGAVRGSNLKSPLAGPEKQWTLKT
eukprot:1580992-Rhodomonas_salina.5